MSVAMPMALEFRKVDILFPASPGRGGRRRVAAALDLLDEGGARAEIADQTGVIVGVSGASLAVEAGEICVLMGLSGSGKSTLLRAANGLNPVTRGEILVRDGEAMVDVGACSPLTLRRIRRLRVAMVFQQFGLLPWRTVRENVGLGLELRGVAKAQRREVVEEKLALVGLSQWADRYASELSGGMQQRVGLARAFATDADILLMDEPFSALDPLIRARLQDELLKLQARLRKTILFVSHDLDEALKLGDRISIMEGGRIIQTGTAEDIMLRPADAYVTQFVAHMNPLTALTAGMVMRRLEDLPTRDGAAVLDPGGRYRLVMDGSARTLSVSVDGVAHNPVAHAEPLDECAGRPVMADEGLSLQSLITLRHISGHPVLITRGPAVVGVCCESDIMTALASRAAGDERPLRAA
jgi:glycine betaine/proline transport system ATP-binding protein